jgi:hypothetical protein
MAGYQRDLPESTRHLHLPGLSDWPTAEGQIVPCWPDPSSCRRLRQLWNKFPASFLPIFAALSNGRYCPHLLPSSRLAVASGAWRLTTNGRRRCCTRSALLACSAAVCTALHRPALLICTDFPLQKTPRYKTPLESSACRGVCAIVEGKITVPCHEGSEHCPGLPAATPILSCGSRLSSSRGCSCPARSCGEVVCSCPPPRCLNPKPTSKACHGII